MTQTNQDFSIYQGDDKGIRFELQDSAGEILGITGASAKWKSAVSPRGPALVSKTATLEIDDGKSWAVVVLSPADTVDLAPFGYYHELQITDGAGQTFTAAVGSMEVRRALIKS